MKACQVCLAAKRFGCGPNGLPQVFCGSNSARPPPRKEKRVSLQTPAKPRLWENYFRRNVMLPLKLVTETEERPSPTSPTNLRPSCVLKLLFQNWPSSIFLVGDAATRLKAELPGIRIVMSPLVERNS